MESYLQEHRNMLQIRSRVQKINESIAKKTFYLFYIQKREILNPT